MKVSCHAVLLAILLILPIVSSLSQEGNSFFSLLFLHIVDAQVLPTGHFLTLCVCSVRFFRFSHVRWFKFLENNFFSTKYTLYCYLIPKYNNICSSFPFCLFVSAICFLAPPFCFVVQCWDLGDTIRKCLVCYLGSTKLIV